jgi:hypothetical protein
VEISNHLMRYCAEAAEVLARVMCFQFANDFLAYRGNVVITDEGNYNMYPIFWDSSIGAFSTSASVISTFPNQPEGGVFLTSAILTPVT